MLSLPSAPALSPLQAFPADGLLAPKPPVTTQSIGLSSAGDFYFYGDIPGQSGPTIDAFVGAVLDVSLATHGKPGSRGGNHWDGDRLYLEVRFMTPTPDLHYLLRLPAHNGQCSYRSLLATLCELDLASTVVMLQPKAGKEGATFINVLTGNHPDLMTPVRGVRPMIGPSREELEAAVADIRAGLAAAQTSSLYANSALPAETIGDLY